MIRHSHLSLFILLFGIATASGSSADTNAPAAVPKRSHSIQDSPGYQPAADPESASVRIGRRVNAPLIRKPFRGGAASLEDLGRQLCRVFERTPTLDSLMALSVSQDEFTDILWPEFPQSRPATGLTAEDAWGVLYPRLLNGTNSALVEHGGLPAEFLRIEVASVARYKNFKLHQGVTFVSRNAAGEEVRHQWLRAVAERSGRFKIYSVRD